MKNWLLILVLVEHMSASLCPDPDLAHEINIHVRTTTFYFKSPCRIGSICYTYIYMGKYIAVEPRWTPKMHKLYYLLYIYLIEIFISQYIGTHGTDVIAPLPQSYLWNCFGLLPCFKAPGRLFTHLLPIFLITLPAAGLQNINHRGVIFKK